jgi:hypothetical protein
MSGEEDRWIDEAGSSLNWEDTQINSKARWEAEAEVESASLAFSSKHT